MAEPLLFPDSEGESDVDSDGDNLMGRRQKHGHEPHSIPWPRLNKIADAIISFYKEDDAFEHERGTQLYRLFQHLRGGPIILQPEEESNRKFLRLLREQPDGPPPVQDNDLPLDKEAAQERLQYETDKLIEKLIKNGKLAPDFANVDGARSSSPVAEDPQSEYDSDTGDGFQQNQSLILPHGQGSPLKNYANEEEDGIPLSLDKQDQKENYDDFHSEDFDMFTPPNPNAKGDLPSFKLISQRPRANFIATPLGWSLLETPSCS